MKFKIIFVSVVAFLVIIALVSTKYLLRSDVTKKYQEYQTLYYIEARVFSLVEDKNNNFIEIQITTNKINPLTGSYLKFYLNGKELSEPFYSHFLSELEWLYIYHVDKEDEYNISMKEFTKDGTILAEKEVVVDKRNIKKSVTMTEEKLKEQFENDKHQKK